MVKRMLIDATHPEETRVVVVNGTKLEEFDVEAASKRQLKGNIYLAKVTRVEPSLQAAFVDYGGNRHGFLAFSEIHPDYYQIPVADREALMAEVKTASREDADANGDDSAEDTVDVVGGDDTDEIEIESEKRRTRNIRSYKIQEVIKRRQILLVQVVKEERGNKGAALTTYLSLAGRYGVLMPNTSRGGGISRKITNVADRKRLKTIISDLKMPEGMAVIIRTAGAERTKAEIRRDCEYLVRTWDEVRELTLGSTAPSLVYEEGSLIKRSLRDIYSKDIEEVIVDGDEGYKNAKDFMKTLMPSHAKKVKRYGKEENLPLLQRYQIESQLDSMHQPTVQLRSGGYIVINPTEALVSIDVNSGRSTRERNIEETAYRTNIEAAEEI
ncbi:MAG: ribonuclease E/G, partial [Rhodospirillales bacterium]